MIASLVFILLFSSAAFIFYKRVSQIRSAIKSGKPYHPASDAASRFKHMLRVALGQQKLFQRPLSALLHVLVYAGFILINIEVIEICIDGLFQTHRVFSILGQFYNFLIAFFEILALLVFIAVVVFWWRRNVLALPRFTSAELKGWPQRDANIILITEMVLMTLLLGMNATDQVLQFRNVEHYTQAGSFPVSGWLTPVFETWSTPSLIFTERLCWWLHLAGILAFLNYLPYSKHLHIILAFPATYYANRRARGAIEHLSMVTDMVAPQFDASYQTVNDTQINQRFGAKDVSDLNWKNLLDAYTCTECGRCTSVCPQNQTGKALSPRKILMDTRDRMEDLSKHNALHGQTDDGKSLLDDYITRSEILACNTCYACVEACPIDLDPLSVIVALRRYMVMEESMAPAEWNGMFSNIENNGAPWQFSPSDRALWTKT